MNDVKRFDCTNGGAKWCQGCYQMTEHPQGDYVSAEDYAALEAEARALRQQVADRSILVVPERMVKTEQSSDEYDMCADHWNACLNELARLNGLTVSASALDTLRRFATGEVGHLNNGHCPDDLEGHEARDPDCPVCRALIETGKESDNV
ncbi:hypothetical protein [Pseudomonas aeruginosa]|uniref:hypothetical protein n=1 Tax=Pseudomonas aeruginosa TaxID=287 RepID=UPI00228B7FDD|nr:hypothetical protein [Pseudomonas aeruginosa]